MTEIMASLLRETRVVLDKLPPETFTSTAHRSRSHRRHRHRHKSHQKEKRMSEKRMRSSSREKVVKRAKRSKSEILDEKFNDLFGSNTPPPPLLAVPSPEPICDISGQGAPNSEQKRPLRSRIQFAESSDVDDDDVQFIESTDTTNSNGTEVKCTDNDTKPCQYIYEKPCPKSKKKNVIIIGNKKKIEKNIQDENTEECPPKWNVKSTEARKMILEFKNTNNFECGSDEIRSTRTQISSKEVYATCSIDESAINIHKTPIIVKSETDIKSEIIEIYDDVNESTLPFKQIASETTSINHHYKLEEFMDKIKNQLNDQKESEKSINNDVPKLTLKPIESLLSHHSSENKKPNTCEQEVLKTPDIEISEMLQIDSTNKKGREQPPPETHTTHCNENAAVVSCNTVQSLAENILLLMGEREKYTKSIEELKNITNKHIILQMKTNAQSQLLQNENVIYEQSLKYFTPKQTKFLSNIIVMEHLNKVTKDLAGKTGIIESFNQDVYTEVLLLMINKAQEYSKKFGIQHEPHGQNSVLGKHIAPCAESIKEAYNENVVTSFQEVHLNNLGSFKKQLEVQTLASTNSSVLNSSVPIPQYSTPSTVINQLYSYLHTHDTQNHQNFHSEISQTSSNATPSSTTSTALNIPNNTYMFPKRAMITQTRPPPPYERTVHSGISGNNESVYANIANHPESSMPMGNIQQFRNNLPLDYTRDSVQRQYQSQNRMLYKQLRTPNAPRNEPYQSNSSYQVAAGKRYVNHLQFQNPPVQTSQPSTSYELTNRNVYAGPPQYPYVNESGSKYGINAHPIYNNLTNVAPSPAIQNMTQLCSTNNVYGSPSTATHGVIKINPTAATQQGQISNGSNMWNNPQPNNRYENQRVANNEEYVYKGSIRIHQSEQDVSYPTKGVVSRTWNDRSQGRPPSAPVLPEQVRSISRDSGFMSPTAAGMSPVVEQPITKCKMCEAFTSLRCTQCMNAYYCSIKCQEKDWNLHQFLCANKISYS